MAILTNDIRIKVLNIFNNTIVFESGSLYCNGSYDLIKVDKKLILIISSNLGKKLDVIEVVKTNNNDFELVTIFIFEN